MTTYVERILARYRNLPETTRRVRANDRLFAAELEQRQIPLHLVEAALLLAALRRSRRDPSAPPLPPIRSLRYIEPILHELRQRPLDPEYLAYLQHHLDRPAPIATRPPPHACGVDDAADDKIP